MRNARLGTLAAAALLAVLAGCSSARDLEPAAEGIGACDRCHGSPPATAQHSAVAAEAPACSTCHSAAVDAAGNLLAAHRNGAVDVTGTHSMPFVTEHTGPALAMIRTCTGCHGADYAGGTSGVSCTGCHTATPGFADWAGNCTFCHGERTASVTAPVPQAAPPAAVVAAGGQTPANPKVGAHQAHVVAGTYSEPLACAACHPAVGAAEALTHFDGGPATVSFGAVASQGVTAPAYDGTSCNVYCHGAGTAWPAGTVAAIAAPAWTATTLGCTACHATPPATGDHGRGDPDDDGKAHSLAACAKCHRGFTLTSVDRAVHVNGSTDVVFTDRDGGTYAHTTGWGDCAGCHLKNPAY